MKGVQGKRGPNGVKGKRGPPVRHFLTWSTNLTATYCHLLRYIWSGWNENCFTPQNKLFHRENQVHQANISLHKDVEQNMSQDRLKDPEQAPSWKPYRDLKANPSWKEWKDSKKLVQALYVHMLYLHSILILLSIKADWLNVWVSDWMMDSSVATQAGEEEMVSKRWSWGVLQLAPGNQRWSSHYLLWAGTHTPTSDWWCGSEYTHNHDTVCCYQSITAEWWHTV